MSMVIKSNTCLPFSRTISDERINRTIRSVSKEEATYMGIWDKIHDWICGTRKSEALEKLYDVTHHDHQQDTESALKTIMSFYELRDMAYPTSRYKFQTYLKENEDGTYTFTFSITDVMNERSLVYGDPKKDIPTFFQKELTNESEYLDSSHVSREGGNGALGKLQMKCSDYYALQHASLTLIRGPERSFDGLVRQVKAIAKSKNSPHGFGQFARSLIENATTDDFSRSISSIESNVQKTLAEKFNNKTNTLYYEPIYEDMIDFQSNCSERTEKKYNKGHINDDIYATVNTKSREKSELLETIDNYIIKNPKEFLSAYEYLMLRKLQK